MERNIYSVKIIIAAHKKYKMPKDEMYLPLHVGAEGKVDADGKPLDFGYTKDNTGDNISELNSSFCELTGLYWGWKNLDTDYVGLVHYRRYFSLKKEKDAFDSVLKYEELRPYLGNVRLFVPNKRRYYIETLYSHYKHTHYSEQLDVTRQILAEKYPEYLENYDRVLKHTYGYMFNMIIMEKTLLNQYCTWLFDILFELKNLTNMDQLSLYQSRCFGRISEIIFNVWVKQQITTGVLKKEDIKELSCIHMEKINWIDKGFAFMRAKLLGKKYEKSF